MKIRLSLAALALIVPAGLIANTYEDNLDSLDVENPEFLLHLNLEDDFNDLGSLLSGAYMAYLATGPQNVPPIPLDFQALFNRLGLSSLKAWTMASEKVGEKGFLNQSLFRFDGAPSGYFLITGRENRSFTIGSNAPADADMVAEMYFDGPVLLEIVRNVLVDLMGDMGRGMIDGQLQQPINEEGLTPQDIIDQLQSKIYVALRADDGALVEGPPAMALLQGPLMVSFSGLGDLLPLISPLLVQKGFTPGQGSSGKAWKLHVGQQGFSLDLYVEAVEASGDLLLYLGEQSRDWFLNPEETIDSVAEYEDMADQLPDEGLSFWFANERISKWQFENIDSQMPEGSPYAGVVAVGKQFLMRFTGTQAGCSFLEEDAYRVKAWQPTSYKSGTAVALLAIPVGMLSALPPPPPPEEAPGEADGDDSTPD